MSTGITKLAVEEIVSVTLDAGKNYNVEELDSSHEHYKRIQADIQAAGLKVLKIEKLQNPSSVDTYTSNMNLMLKQRGGKMNPDYKINERYLYHGTSADKKYICEEGLDDKLAGRGCFGKGIYFSDNVKKCLKYANRREGDEGLILCVRTALGDAKIYEDGEKNPSLMREPEKTGRIKGFRFYCSVKGRPKEYNEFVVYRKSQTLIEYLITYSKTATPEKKTVIETDADPEPTEPISPKELPESSDSEDDDVDAYEGVSSDDTIPEGDDDDTSSLEDFKDALEAPTAPIVPKEPEEEIDPAKKREIFIEKTGEKTDSVIDSFLWATDYHLDIAVDLYLNRDKIEEEMQKLRESLEAEGLPTTDENGKEITFHPEGIPHYDSEGWKLHSESERESFIEKFLSIFMEAIALEAEHREFAKGYLENNKYNIDQTIIAYYSSI